jgi:hypothetical protein
MEYRIVWSDPRGGTGGKIVESAATAADMWIEEFRDKGADAIMVYRDGVRVNVADLPTLMRQETPTATN